MDSVVDLAKSRQARNEKNEHVREASQDLLALLDHHRRHLPEEFMAFLLAMAISDQAIQLSEAQGDRQTGQDFLEEVFSTARQLFEGYYPTQTRPIPARLQHPPRTDKAASRVVAFLPEHPESPLEPSRTLSDD
ncbi:hypothetical protein [Vampirovibrio chlorellavorus]|uniref:hypothetical protein n=1 Tax=Vampirovibrio chlorellavorus TaxID=758823 RepID=UPI0026EBF705|nr:hypothetical protein [Vampirovibrio chlorellavorus]